VTDDDCLADKEERLSENCSVLQLHTVYIHLFTSYRLIARLQDAVSLVCLWTIFEVYRRLGDKPYGRRHLSPKRLVAQQGWGPGGLSLTLRMAWGQKKSWTCMALTSKTTGLGLGLVTHL